MKLYFASWWVIFTLVKKVQFIYFSKLLMLHFEQKLTIWSLLISILAYWGKVRFFTAFVTWNCIRNDEITTSIQRFAKERIKYYIKFNGHKVLPWIIRIVNPKGVSQRSFSVLLSLLSIQLCASITWLNVNDWKWH